MQIAARVANSAFISSAAESWAGQGEAYFRKGRQGWVPGGWESESDADLESEDGDGDGDVEAFVEAEQAVDEDDYGVPLGCETPARRRRERWNKRGLSEDGSKGRDVSVE